MANIRIVPFVVLAVLGVLALVGARGDTFEYSDRTTCGYIMAQMDAPPADIVLIGGSRLGRGIDPGYMMQRIKSRTGQDITIHRLALTFPNAPQFRPLLARYLETRGAPEHAVVQLIYNFREDRQRTWDVPVNNLRNMTFASLDELIAIRDTAPLNDHGTALPRRFEAGYQNTAALFLQKLEINIFAALRYPVNRYNAQTKCAGDRLLSQGRPNWLHNSVSDDMTFSETPKRAEALIRNAAVAADFMPLSPSQPFRRFETEHLKAIIAQLEDAGSTVSLMIMPALGDTEISQSELDEIAAVFPGYDILHPYSLFDTPDGADLARSFVDTHHATPYGGLLFSRYFADALVERGL